MISNISTPLQPLSLPKAGAELQPSGEKSVPAQENNFEFNEQQQAEIKRLKKVDGEVKAHEAAHKNAGGQYAGSASFSYTVGPDGNRYAVGGEVSIDVAPIKGDPEATLAKLDVVIAAALAPVKPSAQDRKVAAAAVAARNQARAELIEQKRNEGTEQDPNAATFDVNDFGDAPIISVNKAYASSNDLVGEAGASGKSLSVIS